MHVGVGARSHEEGCLLAGRLSTTQFTIFTPGHVVRLKFEFLLARPPQICAQDRGHIGGEIIVPRSRIR
jgi:hypothetical protein